jgi:predicted transcriptional regulator
MRVFELEDVFLLLRSEVRRAGGQVAWSKKTGINRATLNKVLNGHQPLTKSIIRALKLRVVFVLEPKSPHSK